MEGNLTCTMLNYGECERVCGCVYAQTRWYYTIYICILCHLVLLSIFVYLFTKIQRPYGL